MADVGNGLTVLLSSVVVSSAFFFMPGVSGMTTRTNDVLLSPLFILPFSFDMC